MPLDLQFPPGAAVLHWILAAELLIIMVLAVMWFIGLILGRLKDQEDQIAIFVRTFWHEVFYPPTVMSIDGAIKKGGKSTARGGRSEPSEEDEFYGRTRKGEEGHALKADLMVFVEANAPKDVVLGRDGDGLKVQVSGEVGDSRSNKALIEMIAAAIGVKPYQVTLTKGHYHPRKTIQIQGISNAELQEKLGAVAEAQ